MQTAADLDAGGIEFLGAVQNVLQGKSAATEADLIGAAACQFLRQGPASQNQIEEAVKRIWPLSSASAEQVASAMDLSASLGLVAMDDSKKEWFLTANGLTDIQQHASWVLDLRKRTAAQIRIRSRQGLGHEPDATEAGLWLDALVRALVPAIQDSLNAHLGAAKTLVEGKITTRLRDPDIVMRKLDDASLRPEIVDLLKSLAFAALDPMDPFGLELVTHITTGCILHSYVAGSSGRQLTGALGKPVRQRAILDTPVLLSLIGPARDQKDTELSIRRAIADGWEVVVATHSLEELTELVDRELPRLQRLYREANEQQAKMEFYAALVDDQFHGIIIAALREGTYSRLQDVSLAARHLGNRLENFGVTVRPNGNSASLDRRQKCQDALTEHLERTKKYRSEKVILRDAETLTMAWRRRRRETSRHWPGAWIITADTAMAPAYSAVSNDPVAITLTLPQWTTVLAISASSNELTELATAAAGQFVDEAVWQLPARFPEEFAMKLAAQLSPAQGGSNLDLHQAQKILALPEMLDKIASNTSAATIAAEVLAERARRINALNERDRTQRVEEVASAYVEASAAQARELEAQRKLNAAAAENNQLQNQLSAARQASEEAAGDSIKQKQRFTRIICSIGIILGTVISFILTLIFGTLMPQLLAGTVVFASIVLGIQWCRNLESKLHMLAWTLVIETVGALSAIQSLLGSLGPA